MATPDDSQAALAERIIAERFWGDTTLTDPAWRKAWDAVPRAAFVPDDYFEWESGAWHARSRREDPTAWTDLVATHDQPVITQITGGLSTCSVSAPVLVAAMLGGLDVADGMTVLESGTGAGWTASLLSARLGDRNVVSVEYDPHLADLARDRAAAAGFRPLILSGDGEAGHPARAPYDRVAATHAVDRIPPAWIAQTAVGGAVCAPLFIARGLDLYVRLTVHGDGSASGPVLFPVAFMTSRSSTAGREPLADGPARESVGTLDVSAVLARGELWVPRLALPGLEVTGPLLEDGDDTVWLQTPDGSWAVAWTPRGAAWGGCEVRQYGPRDLWALAEDAYASWLGAGGPGLDRYGLTVRADGTHRIWLDKSSQVVSVLG